MQQRRGHRQPLLEPAGQIAAGQSCEGCELKLLQSPVDAVSLARGPEVIGAGEELQILGHRELAVKRELLGDVADPLARRGAGATQIHSRHPQRAAGSGQQSAQHAKRRGLACAVGTEQAEDLAPLNIEADVVNGNETAELADQIADLDDGVRTGDSETLR